MTFKNAIVAGILAAGLMVSALPVYAQEETAPEGAGEAASELPTLPSENWIKVCDTLEDGQRACLIRQIVATSTGQFMGSFILRDDPGQESRLTAVAAVPTGVLLPFGLTWQIDNGQPVRVPFLICDLQSCSAQLMINEAYVNSLKRGGVLKLVSKNRQNQDITVEVNLAGFTATYDGDVALRFDDLRQQQTDTGLERRLEDFAERQRRALEESNGEQPPAEGQ